MISFIGNLKPSVFKWVAQNAEALPSIMGRLETFHLLSEARGTFVDGHYLASLIVALAVIEHILIEELQRTGNATSGLTFDLVIQACERRKLFHSDCLASAKQLSLRRNGYAHLKSLGHKDTLGERVGSEKIHPESIKEEDAKCALVLMYKMMSASLAR